MKYFLLLFLFSGCTSYQLTSPQEIEKFESSSSFHHLIYVGSNSEFHYFHVRDKTITKYKIPSTELEIENKFNLNPKSKECFVMWPGSIEKFRNSAIK